VLICIEEVRQWNAFSRNYKQFALDKKFHIYNKMPVNKFGHTDVDNIQSVVSGGVTLSQMNSTFLRLDGENTATGDINLGSHKLINVLNPTEAQDAATKEYVDNRASVSQSQFHYPIGTGGQTYSWVDLQEVQGGTTESQWDSLPSGLCLLYRLYSSE
jgi:hypothetical protein